MRAHGAIDIERRAEQWRERGWTGFDTNAEPYTAEQIDRERGWYEQGAAGDLTGGPTSAGPGGEIADRGTAGSIDDRGTPRRSGAGTD